MFDLMGELRRIHHEDTKEGVGVFGSLPSIVWEKCMRVFLNEQILTVFGSYCSYLWCKVIACQNVIYSQ